MASGISAILGTVSFIGALLTILGIGIAVVSASQGRGVRLGAILAVVGVVLFLVFQLISRGVIVVQPTQVAVVFRTLSGDLADEPRDAGTHIVYPVFEEAILYPINVQEYTMSGTPTEGAQQGDDAVRARTEDGQEVLMDITVLYRVDPAQVNTLHRLWFDNQTRQPNYEREFVRPTVRALVRDVASRFTAREIYGETRTDMRDQMEQVVAERFQEEGLILNDLLLRDVTFSDQFRNAIEQAQVAEQQANRAEIEVRRIEQEAEQARARAAGERDARIARAEGEAQATILQAQAEAEALRLVSEQIAANPALIQYQYVQNLSDNVSIALVPSTSPFLFDFDSLPQANPDLQAPETEFDPEQFESQFEEGVPGDEIGATTDDTAPAATPTPGTGN
jgi:regulator of protease activity HflC (stomatin/prohibitin superfamily)